MMSKTVSWQEARDKVIAENAAPKAGCVCRICVWARENIQSKWVPVVVTREPFFGILKERQADGTLGDA
jgi:hypothetical protein